MYSASLEQTMALAGIFQAATLVDHIARQGLVSQDALEASIASLFVTNPKATEDVYGGRQQLRFNLSTGLKTLQRSLDKSGNPMTPHITRYALSMIALERKLAKNPKFLTVIGERLEGLEKKAEFFTASNQDEGQADNPSRFTHGAIIAGLDQLYQDTISQFSFRIQVQGDPRQLQNTENAARIRALLLAGIRSAMLWKQVGGHRWHFLFLRARLREPLKRLNA